MQLNLIKYAFFTLLTASITSSCTREQDNIPVPVPPADTRQVLLKEVLAQNLPSPYFQLKYNDSGYTTHLNFASNMFTYVFTYENKRIHRMTNTVDGSYLLYNYSNGDVSNIRRVEGATGKSQWKYEFVYYPNRQLKQVSWYRFPASGADSVLERKVVLVYDASGNLAEYDDLRNNAATGLAWSNTVEFAQYDQGVNVSDFYLLKDFFDDVIFLPQLKLQKNNPGRVTIKGLVNDFELVNTYQYNARNLPVAKITRMKQTRGQGTGQEITLTDQYTYY